MLRSLSELKGYALVAEDGTIGRCKDFLFDDEQWTVRHMVADTGKWLPGKKVLISPLSLKEAKWSTKQFLINLTKQQIENCPPIEEDAPVSRLHEIRYYDYHKWPYYWTGGYIWGGMTHPYPSVPTPPVVEEEPEPLKENDNIDPEESHLRSVKEVTRYHIKAEDGSIGHVEDFIAEDDVWTIRYMVVDTKNWIPGRKVLVSPGWISGISWLEREVEVNLTTEAIKNGPEYDPSEPVNREYEVRLYDFYGRPKYWH